MNDEGGSGYEGMVQVLRDSLAYGIFMWRSAWQARRAVYRSRTGIEDETP